MEYKFGNNVIQDSKRAELFATFIVGGKEAGKTTLLFDCAQYMLKRNNCIIHYIDTNKDLTNCVSSDTFKIVNGVKDGEKTFQDILEAITHRERLFHDQNVSNIEAYNKKAKAEDQMGYLGVFIDEAQEFFDSPNQLSLLKDLVGKGRAEGLRVIIASTEDNLEIRQLCPFVIVMKNPNIAEKVLQSKLYNADLNILHEAGDFIGELQLAPKDDEEAPEIKILNNNIKYFKM